MRNIKKSPREEKIIFYLVVSYCSGYEFIFINAVCIVVMSLNYSMSGMSRIHLPRFACIVDLYVKKLIYCSADLSSCLYKRIDTSLFKFCDLFRMIDIKSIVPFSIFVHKFCHLKKHICMRSLFVGFSYSWML